MPQSALSLFEHVFINHQADQTLFLLHGTGGDERDLLPLVAPWATDYNWVGLKGNVREQGMARFFARTGLGQFDQKSIQAESAKLARFLRAWYQQYQVTPSQAAFMGYSNGANMILALAFSEPELISRAVLLHPMLPFVPGDVDLAANHYLVTLGTSDPLIPSAESHQVINTLRDRGATVEVIEHPGGHEIRAAEISALESFFGFNRAGFKETQS